MGKSRYEFSHDLRLIALVMEHPETLYKWAEDYLFQQDHTSWEDTDLCTRINVPAFAEYMDQQLLSGYLAEAVRDIYDRLKRDGQV